MGRRALVVNLGFEASLGPVGVCTGSGGSCWLRWGEPAPAMAPAAPIRDGAVLVARKPGRPGPKSPVTPRAGLAKGLQLRDCTGH